MSEAKEELSELLAMVERGEDVVIAREGTPIARLVRVVGLARPREAGALKGKLWIADDFDAPDPELEQLFLSGPIEPTV